jgi:plastocyanin
VREDTLQSTRGNEQPPPPVARGPFEWKHVLLLSVAISVIVFIALMVIQQTLIPPIVIFIVLALIGAFLLRARERAGAIMLAIVSILFFLLDLPFTLPALAVPESSVDFLASSLTTLSLIAMAVSSVAIIRGRSEGNAVRFSVIITVLGALAVIASVAARITYEGAELQPGDIEVALEDVEFLPQRISASGGEEVSVYLDNRDTVFHTFTIEELDVDVEIPGNGSARVTFEASPGTYEVTCRPHEPDMTGTLDVEG